MVCVIDYVSCNYTTVTFRYTAGFSMGCTTSTTKSNVDIDVHWPYLRPSHIKLSTQLNLSFQLRSADDQ